MKKYSVLIIGATGLVGRTLLELLDELAFPYSSITLMASAKKKQRNVIFKGAFKEVLPLDDSKFKEFDFIFLTCPKDVSIQYHQQLLDSNTYVIDNTSAYRYEKEIPLIVPEINMKDYLMNKYIANPNCSTIQGLLPLYYFSKKFEIKSINYTTYQSVSGSGQKGVEELLSTRIGEQPSFYKYNISGNIIAQIDEFEKDGYTKEEIKMINETKKILHDQNLLVSSTCVRVPVFYCHGVCVRVTFKKKVTVDELVKCLQSAPGIKLYLNNELPLNEDAKYKNEVLVGRIRKDYSLNNSFLLWTIANNLKKGAALNAIQIALGIINDQNKFKEFN